MRTETQFFPRRDAENRPAGHWATLWRIEKEGEGATVTDATAPDGWTLTATFDEGARESFFDMMRAKGFTGYHSGGGCCAMARHFGDGGNVFQILITGGDVDMPEPGGEWFVGAYDPDCDCFHEAQGEGDETLALAIDAAIKAVEARRAAETDETRAKRDEEHAALVARYS